jgi:amino acid transporter
MTTTPTKRSSAPSGGILKRIVLGRAIASAQQEHHLLPKRLALPVFASDQLSSVAYATEQMMLILVTAGSAALGLMTPLAVGVGALLAIVIASYRQTCRAYPRGGGSYIVAKENLGTIPGLVAAAAIQTSYVLTVAVSVTAGAIAVTSAAPSLASYKVQMALGFIALITIANLRGAKEAGRLFALPTYGFVVMVFATLISGLLQCFDGCPIAASSDLPLEPVAGLTVFLALRAFSSGATALTGVEAIADGVQAFQRPQARNAAATLAIMGAMSIPMFLGITLFADLLQVRVDEDLAASQSVLSQIGETVFGRTLPFWALQTLTAAILVLAANTAYQDFPRLASILAGDRFMPSQFRNRGDRLVFSNGVLSLALLAAVLVWLFQGELSRLIHLYVVGVFTAITLSQAGMVRRWYRDRGARWQRNLAINGIGVVTTGGVLAIIAVTQFALGAWIVIAAMPFIVGAFLLVHRHYEHVMAQLRRGRIRPSAEGVGVNHMVLVIRDLDVAAAEAVGVVRSIRPTELHILHPSDEPIPPDLQERWREFSANAQTLEQLPLGKDNLLDAVKRYVRGIKRAPEDFVNVVIPEVVQGSLLGYLLRRAALIRLKAGLLREQNIVVTDVPVVVEDGRPVGVDARPLIPERTVALAFVSSVHDATVRAANYAETLEASETRAVYFDLDADGGHRMQEEWGEAEMRIPLDIAETPFRDLSGPMLDEVRSYTSRPGTLVLVVIPELVVSKWRHVLLHNQNALFVKRLLLFEPNVVLSSVPFVLSAEKSQEVATG